MDREDIEALRASVTLLRDGNDALVNEAIRQHLSPPDDPTRPARHIDELLSAHAMVEGDGFLVW